MKDEREYKKQGFQIFIRRKNIDVFGLKDVSKQVNSDRKLIELFELLILLTLSIMKPSIPNFYTVLPWKLQQVAF